MSIQSFSGHLVDVVGNRIFKGEIGVLNGIITSVREKEEVEERYIAPGLVDAHVHIESSMLTPVAFARQAVLHGTVAAVSDPHEIANVLGITGVRFMIENGQKTAFKFCFGAPSCVPATPYETSGATLDEHDVAQLLAMPEIGFLSEMMNYPGVIHNDPAVLQKISSAKQLGKPIDGHAPQLRGSQLQKYVAAGISTDHECSTLEEAYEKIALGMKILIREGSAAKNFEALKPLIKSHPNNIMLCSDDIHPNDLVKGHINLLVKRALKSGADLVTALRICTCNPVRHYNLRAGLLQVGDAADFITFDNPEQFTIQEVYINGALVAECGKSYVEPVKERPLNLFTTHKLTVADIEVLAQTRHIRVIDVIENELITKLSVLPAFVVNGKVESDLSRDVLKMVHLNRYQNAKPAIAFVRNFGIKSGAIASSVVHDSHNILCVGVEDADIVAAINALIATKGGISATCQGVTDVVPLPFGGIMDNRDAHSMARDYERINAKAKEMGATCCNPFMTLSFMGLPVIPELKLSDKGLFDGVKFAFTPLFIAENRPS